MIFAADLPFEQATQQAAKTGRHAFESVLTYWNHNRIQLDTVIFFSI